jgi:hypothetical protein
MTKIAYFGHHKCASSFIIAVMRSVSNSLGLRMQVEFLSSRLPLGYEMQPGQAARIAEAYRLLAGGRYDVVCHGNADQAVIEAVSKPGKMRGFHVIRDPRDLVVSGYFWHQSGSKTLSQPPNPWRADRMNRLRQAETVEDGLLLEIEFSACYLEALAGWDYQQQNVLEMKYEQMILDPFSFFSAALEYVGLRIIDRPGKMGYFLRLNRIAYQHLHRSMIRLHILPGPTLQQILADHAFERKAGGRQRGEALSDHKYRKGIAGDWRNHFTPRVTSVFKERYAPLLVKLGYEHDERW